MGFCPGQTINSHKKKKNQEGHKQDRVLADVDLEGLRHPSSNSLDDVRGDASFCECGGSTGTHGLATNIMEEVGL